MGLLDVSLERLLTALKILVDEGIIPEAEGYINLFIEDPKIRKRLKDHIQASINITLPYENAKSILSTENFWGPHEWINHGVKFTEEQFNQVLNFPWGKEVLELSCPFLEGMPVRRRHLGFLGVHNVEGRNLTIDRWEEEQVLGKFNMRCNPSDLRYKNPFKKTTTGLRWYLIYHSHVPESRDKTYAEQVSLLPKEYEVPKAAVAFTMLMLFKRKNCAKEGSSMMFRCSDNLSEKNKHITVGCNKAGMIEAKIVDDNRTDHNLGILASRKLPVAAKSVKSKKKEDG